MRPLPKATARALETLVRFGDRPSRTFNPGVVQFLTREGLATLVDKPSPYASHKRGTRIAYLTATAAGRARHKEQMPERVSS